jgi:Ca-activated chloride channel family protein
VLIALLLAVVASASAQSAVSIEIVSPPDGAYVSDRMTIEARIMPVSRRSEIKEITFYADGRLICRSTDANRPVCAWDAGAIVKPHQFRVVATLGNGERVVATRRTREIDVNESVSVQVVQINALVFDRSGKFVSGLRPEQFRVVEDGVPQKVLHFAAEEAPLEIVIAVDISASMGHAVEELEAAVRQFVSRLKATDQVTLVAFNDEMFVLAQREHDRVKLFEAIDRLTSFGGTTLYDVIIRSLEMLSRQPGRRSLVVFSDGEDQSSQANFAIVDRALRSNDATLFMVALGRGKEIADLRETIQALAEPTGGRALFADNPSDLDAAFAELLDELTHQYLIGYESTNVARDGAWRKLEVEVPGTTHRIRARQGYYGPKT